MHAPGTSIWLQEMELKFARHNAANLRDFLFNRRPKDDASPEQIRAHAAIAEAMRAVETYIKNLPETEI